MDADKTYIYGLLCPIETKIRYVGQSVQPVERYRQHLASPRGVMKGHSDWREKGYLSNPKEAWLGELLDRDLEPELVILEILDYGDDAPQGKERKPPHLAEQAWVRQLLNEGHPLTNIRDCKERRDAEILEEAIELGREMFG